MKNDLTIIIPTRNTVSNRTLESLPKNISLLVGVDRGEGQTKIRYDLAKKCFTKYILLLDDDVVLNEFDRVKERSIQDKASELSSRFNKTISVTVISSKEAKKNDNFIKSVKKHMVLLYGKEPF